MSGIEHSREIPYPHVHVITGDVDFRGHRILNAQVVGSGGITLAEVIDALYPVGALYTSTLSTNPGTLLGRGTWSAFGAGRVMVGHNAGDEDFDTPEETGGAKTSSEVVNHSHSVTVTDSGHNHTQNAHTHTQDAHTHLQNAHTHVQDAHSHTIPVGATDDTSAPFDRADAGSNTAGANATTATGTATAVNQNATAVNQNATATNQNATATNNSNTTGITASTANPAGGVASFSIMPPYIVIYAWKRTA